MRGKIKILTFNESPSLPHLASLMEIACNSLLSNDEIISVSHAEGRHTTPWSEQSHYTGLIAYREGTR